MCTELFLAILYFCIIFLVNFFLFKLLKNYIENILFLLKLKNIFNNYKKEDLSIIALLYFYSSKNLNYKKLLNSSSLFLEYNDILLIGNIYKKLKEKKSIDFSLNYYLTLQEKQYLSEKLI